MTSTTRDDADNSATSSIGVVLENCFCKHSKEIVAIIWRWLSHKLYVMCVDTVVAVVFPVLLW